MRSHGVESKEDSDTNGAGRILCRTPKSNNNNIHHVFAIQASLTMYMHEYMHIYYNIYTIWDNLYVYLKHA